MRVGKAHFEGAAAQLPSEARKERYGELGNPKEVVNVEVTGDQYSQLTVFTPQGKSNTFKRIRNVEVNESVVSFDYTAMSDGRVKHATFFIHHGNITGYTTTP